MGFFSREILIHSLLAWGKLFANPYELKSRIYVWEEYNHVHFERIYKVCRFDRFLSTRDADIQTINQNIEGPDILMLIDAF